MFACITKLFLFGKALAIDDASIICCIPFLTYFSPALSMALIKSCRNWIAPCPSSPKATFAIAARTIPVTTRGCFNVFEKLMISFNKTPSLPPSNMTYLRNSTISLRKLGCPRRASRSTMPQISSVDKGTFPAATSLFAC